jgi:hypothetical protein
MSDLNKSIASLAKYKTQFYQNNMKVLMAENKNLKRKTPL